MMGTPYENMVCIHCMTYNQEKYIEDTLKGFVMQKTDFPFIAVVFDDFSTDGTADIIRRYEKITGRTNTSFRSKSISWKLMTISSCAVRLLR